MIRYPTLPELVHLHAAETPDRVALVSVEQRSVTWAELEVQQRLWAQWLHRHGVAAGDRVVTLLPQSLESSFAWLGICGVGAIEVSVNSGFRGEWLRHALEVAGVRHAIVAQRYLDAVLAVLGETQLSVILIPDADAPPPQVPEGVTLITDFPQDPAITSDFTMAPFPQPHDTACVLYTSGTTGKSKAVELPWHMLAKMISADPKPERPQDQVFYLPYAPYHLSGRGSLYRGALAGAKTVVREAFSTSAFWDDVRDHGVTWTILYAAPARFLMAREETPLDTDNTLEWVLMCPVLPETDALCARFGVLAYGVYGMTEVGTPLVVPPEHCISEKSGTCGIPVQGYEARLVDANDYPVPEGAAGELILRSSEPWALNTGYLGNPAASHAAWRNGWFHTGDIMRRDTDGLYYFMDRSKDMIRRRGENIASIELEAEILRVPGVREAVVVGVPSTLGDEEILAIVVGDAHLNPREFWAILTERVPKYAVPRFLRPVASLPRTEATQRIQKHILRTEGITPDTWDRELF